MIDRRTLENRPGDEDPVAIAFSGPLFLVGRPRSGTKMLRTLLNMHADVGIPISETNFFPELIGLFGKRPGFDDPEELDRFYAVFQTTPFFTYRQRQGIAMSKETLVETAGLASWESIAHAILSFYSPRSGNPRLLWGDKSPSYLSHMLLLKDVMPGSRFIHIIRDPRDQALSAKKAWGKSLLRSAEVWRREVGRARIDGARLGGDYMELRFEDLLERPESLLIAICDFLGIEFDAQMVKPTVSHEDRGHAAGRLEIVSENRGKFTEGLGTWTLRRLEEIVHPVATELGYEMDHVQPRPLSATALRTLAVYDAVRMAIFYIEDQGLRWSARHVTSAIRKRVATYHAPQG